MVPGDLAFWTVPPAPFIYLFIFFKLVPGRSASRAGQCAARQLTQVLVSWYGRKWSVWFQKFSLLRCNGEHIVPALGGDFYFFTSCYNQVKEVDLCGLGFKRLLQVSVGLDIWESEAKTRASSSSAALLGGGGGVRSGIGIKWQLWQLHSFVYITVMLGSFQAIWFQLLNLLVEKMPSKV